MLGEFAPMTGAVIEQPRTVIPNPGQRIRASHLERLPNAAVAARLDPHAIAVPVAGVVGPVPPEPVLVPPDPAVEATFDGMAGHVLCCGRVIGDLIAALGLHLVRFSDDILFLETP